ncbi:reverse transcriptase domain-containing protein [Vibrio anguillarum]|uniref:reverse transcriptase domain-containing protein n=1 Tax=Vibrio anguillarum TaxID=55601 RepID=UPI001F491256|nr:reverse transcriptase domain-containing protein [Vibrio anguillarum]UJQ40393.1 reverse transcriptase family protein [Vibrio anguillarum]
MENIEQKRSLEEVFNSTFHSKLPFSALTELTIDSEFKHKIFNNRDIYLPTDKLKKIHRFVNGSILEYAEINRNVVFSYRKGVSIRDAVEKHTCNKFFFQTDIKNFYGSISKKNISDIFDHRFDMVPISDLDNYRKKLLDLMVINDQLPAGFSTSPMLSNICLFDFDNELEQYCNESHLTYTRYSDDIIISSSEKENLTDLSEFIQSLLYKHVNKETLINDNKTKIVKHGSNVKILGFSILPNGELTISSKDKKEIEILLHFFLNDAEKFNNYIESKLSFKHDDSSDRNAYDSALSSLCGRIVALNSMDKKYLDKLRRKYGNTLIEMFLRKTVLKN